MCIAFEMWNIFFSFPSHNFFPMEKEDARWSKLYKKQFHLRPRSEINSQTTEFILIK